MNGQIPKRKGRPVQIYFNNEVYSRLKIAAKEASCPIASVVRAGTLKHLDDLDYTKMLLALYPQGASSKGEGHE